MSTPIRLAAGVAAAALLAACAGEADAPPTIAMGPNPTLEEPQKALIPALNVAEAVGWTEGQAPAAAQGLQVAAFAEGLNHPRWLYVLPNGDVLVAETNAPPKPEGMGGGIRGWFMDRAMKKAGAAVPSPNRIILLRDADGDGVAETRNTFLENLFSPFGMALAGDRLYVANADAIVSFPYQAGATSISGAAVTLTDLPAGRNHHWTKGLVASADGARLYASVGSNSNIGENGMEEEEGRAAIWEVDIATGEKRLFATGLRNPVGMDWNPAGGALWVAVNERDELGHNLVPDYITSVRQGGFYGWPWSYYGQHVDERVQPQQPDMVASAIPPDYALGAHTASLGLTFADGAALGPQFASGAFVGQHGSWNRNPRSGYKVIFVPFNGAMPVDGLPQDVLTGFLDEEEDVAHGRPVGVAIGADGALLVADDVGNVIWRVTAPGVALRPMPPVTGPVPGADPAAPPADPNTDPAAAQPAETPPPAE